MMKDQNNTKKRVKVKYIIVWNSMFNETDVLPGKLKNCMSFFTQNAIMAKFILIV